ncbi:NfeD family protein [Sulfuricurvum sp.]|uniref:NfeD family protein n=1 Tax=Sulfuricurvum sp. TaxID=2025608 RepID=UPI002D71E5DB|nr:NfeD family protein [Sulfuricurvum sp.]HZF70493.1 NfeD family protein [Sulfuricurvum sp.]
MSYYIWLMLGVIALVVEMMLPTFFALFAGIGCIAAAAVAFFLPTSLVAQLVIASVFMIIGAVVFKKRHIGDDERDAVGTHNEFVGIRGIALTSLSSHHEGQVELYEPVVSAREWSALSTNEDIDANAEIRIVQLRGNTLIVEKV